MLHVKNPLLETVYRECGGKAVTSRRGTAAGGERGCGSAAVPSGWPLGSLNTPLCWAVPALWNSARELWGERKALQMNPMEGEAFSLQGHAALSWLADFGIGMICVRARCAGFTEHTLALYPHEAHSHKPRRNESVPSNLGLSQQIGLEAPRDQFRKRNS